MAFKSYGFNCTNKNLLDGDFSGGNVYAQLVGNGYTFSDAHTTRANFTNFNVGTPVPLANKTVTYSGKTTSIKANNPTFSGTPSARWVAFLFWNGTSAAATDKLISIVDLNSDGAVDVLIDQGLLFSDAGILQFTFSNS